ncbi:hypothetical protein COP2_003071 [Malus domestica]
MSSNPQETHMASRNDQVVPATNTKNKNILAASGGTLGVTTQSKTRALSTVLSTSTSTLSKKQEHSRHEPVITLALLKAPREESSISYPIAIQVMTTGATLIEEQLAQMNETIARLTSTGEEKDL